MRKLTKIILLIICLLLILLGCFALWLGTGKLTSAKTSFLKTFPYPIALVNGQAISGKNFILRLNAANRLSDESTDDAKIAAYNQLIKEEEIRQIAYTHNLWVSQKEMDAEYDRQSSQAEFKATLNNAGLSPSDFKNQVIGPKLLLNKLRVWFNSQRSLNQKNYALADSLTEKITLGQDMPALASTYSQDQTGQLTGGDLGFVDPAGLVSELREPVANLKTGEVKVLPSSFGLHVIKKEGQTGNKAHLRQIFLENSGFDAWLNNQTSKAKVWNLVKI